MSPHQISQPARAIAWVSAGGHAAAAAAQAASYARAVLKGEQTLMEALADIVTFVATYPEHVAGEPLGAQKARQLVLDFVRHDVVERNKQLPLNWGCGLTKAEKADHRKYFGMEARDWTLDRALDHLTQKFAETPATAMVERMSIIDEVLLGMARSPMRPIDIEKVLSYVHKAGRTNVPIRAFRKRLNELRRGALKGENHREIALALIKELERQGEVRFWNDTFYRWAGSHWTALKRSEVRKVIVEEFGSLPLASRRLDHLGICEVAGALVSGKPLASVDVPGINFANGYLTADLELRQHDPAFGATYVLPYRYVEGAPTPARFMSVLDRCWNGDVDYAEKVQALREAIAVTMFGMATNYTRAICLYGIQNSGKTVIMEVLEGMVPEDSVSNVSPHDWGDKYLSTQMLGRLINFCGEVSETKMIKGDRFKMIVEGSTLNGQFKYGQIFKFKPTCAQWFSSNHLPRTRDSSGGFTRRWLFLTFNRALPAQARIVGIKDVILADEREAIAAWALPAISGVLRRQDYTIPASHNEQIDEIANLNNSVRHFLKSSRVIYGPDLATHQGALFAAYVMFAKSAGHRRSVGRPGFRAELRMLQRELGFRVQLDEQSEPDPPIYGITVRRGA